MSVLTPEQFEELNSKPTLTGAELRKLLAHIYGWEKRLGCKISIQNNETVSRTGVGPKFTCALCGAESKPQISGILGFKEKYGVFCKKCYDDETQKPVLKGDFIPDVLLEEPLEVETETDEVIEEPKDVSYESMEKDIEDNPYDPQETEEEKDVFDQIEDETSDEEEYYGYEEDSEIPDAEAYENEISDEEDSSNEEFVEHVTEPIEDARNSRDDEEVEDEASDEEDDYQPVENVNHTKAGKVAKIIRQEAPPEPEEREHSYSFSKVESYSVDFNKTQSGKLLEKFRQDNTGIFTDFEGRFRNPFKNDRYLFDEFKRSKFYNVIETALHYYENKLNLHNKTFNQDRNFKRVTFKIQLSDRTFEVPIVDFSNGVRVVFVDLNRPDGTNANIELVSNRVRFGYSEFGSDGQKNFNEYWIYSDSANFKSEVTGRSLGKILASKSNLFINNVNAISIAELEKYYSVDLARDNEYIKRFEKTNSPITDAKPCSGAIMLAVKYGEDSTGNKNKIYQNIMKAMNNRVDLDDLNVYVVATARYLTDTESIKGVTIYNVVNYTEFSDILLTDGPGHIVGVLAKEHFQKYRNFNFMVSFEMDRSALPSPSFKAYISLGRFSNSTMLSYYYNKYSSHSYIKRLNVRTDLRDEFRIDPRFVTLSRATFVTRFMKELRNAGYKPGIHADKWRKFADEIGLVACRQQPILYLQVDMSYITGLLTGERASDTFSMMNVTFSDLMAGSSISSSFNGDNAMMQMMLAQMMANEQ